MDKEKHNSRRLPVLKILVRAFSIPWGQRKPLIRSLAIPFIALAILHTIGHMIADTSYFLTPMAVSAMSGLFFVLFAVRCHRFVLLGQEMAPPYPFIGWTPRETRFLGWMFGIYITVGAIFIGVSAVAYTITATVSEETKGSLLMWSLWLAIAVYTLFLARLSLIFPATAIDQRPDMKWAWELSKGNGLRLFAIVGILPWLSAVLPDLLLREDASILEVGLVNLVATALLVVEITALSLCYRELAKDPNQGQIL